MALVTFTAVWLAAGVTVSVVMDDVTEVAQSATVDNDSDKPARVSMGVGARARGLTVAARRRGVRVTPPGPPAGPPPPFADGLPLTVAV